MSGAIDSLGFGIKVHATAPPQHHNQAESCILPPMSKQNGHFDARRRWRTATLVAGTGGLSVVVAIGWVIREKKKIETGYKRKRCPALVFGCPPGQALNARILGAFELLCNGQADRIVVSGRGEASHARQILIDKGVNADQIKLETEARNTLENLLFASSLLDGGPFWAVSDRWHLPRISAIARTLNMDAIPHPVDRVQTRTGYARQIVREGLSVTHRWANRDVLL